MALDFSKLEALRHKGSDAPKGITVAHLHQQAKGKLPGTLLLNAIENYVPADFCNPSAVGSDGYYSEVWVARLLRETVRKLASSETTRWMFVGDNVRDRWEEIKTGYLEPFEDGKCQVGVLYGKSLDAFELLIMNGFVSPKKSRQPFWDKFLMEHATKSFTSIRMNCAEKWLERKPRKEPVAAALYDRAVMESGKVMFHYLKFVRFEPDTGRITTEYPKEEPECYTNAMMNRKEEFENVLSKTFGMPITLEMQPKDE